ncbi:MAG: hypothetical protein LUP95_00620 [Euryarchaeota archaeon]|nr:hypothetical protein [Euryarchaeota archaeon]
MNIRRELLIALAVTTFGAVLIYASSRSLDLSDPSQALIAYVGVFVVAVGILFVASLLLFPPHRD